MFGRHNPISQLNGALVAMGAGIFGVYIVAALIGNFVMKNLTAIMVGSIVIIVTSTGYRLWRRRQQW